MVPHDVCGVAVSAGSAWLPVLHPHAEHRLRPVRHSRLRRPGNILLLCLEKDFCIDILQKNCDIPKKHTLSLNRKNTQFCQTNVPSYNLRSCVWENFHIFSAVGLSCVKFQFCFCTLEITCISAGVHHRPGGWQPVFSVPTHSECLHTVVQHHHCLHVGTSLIIVVLLSIRIPVW